MIPIMEFYISWNSVRMVYELDDIQFVSFIW